MNRIARLGSLGLMVGFAMALQCKGQGLAREGLASFSSDTIRVEYASAAKLRSLPNYESLRQKFIGPRLRDLEKSFAGLGVGERDIDEIILAWRPGESMMELSGLVAGRFTARQIAERAGASGVTTSAVGNSQAYCMGSGTGTSCLVVLRDSLGLFGELGARL